MAWILDFPVSHGVILPLSQSCWIPNTSTAIAPAGHPHCLPQGLVGVWFGSLSLLALSSTQHSSYWVTLPWSWSGRRGRGKKKNHVSLPFFPSPFWEAVWMLQGPWQEMLNPWAKGTLQLSATSANSWAADNPLMTAQRVNELKGLRVICSQRLGSMN